MSPIKNVLKIDKTYFSKNRSYALNAGVYYNLEGFSSVTNNIHLLQGTYNPDKYILGHITKPNMKTFVNYDNKEKEHKGNNTKININNIKENKETYAYVSNIMVPTIQAEVKPILEIIKEKLNIIKNKNVIINSKLFKDKVKEEIKVKDNIISNILKSKSSVSLLTKYNNINENNNYTYTNNININWYNYVDKIYLLHSKQDNSRTLNNLLKVGIVEYDTYYYKTELLFNEYKYYKSIRFLDAIEDAYSNKNNSILILKDDIKFIDDYDIIILFLDESKKYDISLLNPNDIDNDCLILNKTAIEYIHNLHIDITKINWINFFSKNIKEHFNIFKPIYDICLHLIDYVLPYVDGNDIEWLKIHNLYKIKETGELNTTNRFRSFDNLLYLFRGIEKYCKFIDNIYLIVMQESQIPNWVNKEKVYIIYHKDFMPIDKLPCFSSCMIETFMTNIKDLSEYFLYGNDDIFITDITNRTYWFKNGVSNINMVNFEEQDDFFSLNCARSWKIATKEFTNTTKYYRTSHTINGILKSVGEHLHKIYEVEINNSISKFRGEHDFNQYLYVDYLYALNNLYFKKLYKTKYISIENNLSLYKLNNIEKYKLICINDCIKHDADFEYIKNQINNKLNNLLPNKSIYEK